MMRDDYRHAFFVPVWAGGQSVHGAVLIVTALTRSVRYLVNESYKLEITPFFSAILAGGLIYAFGIY